MIDPANVPPVAPDEWLARYVLYSKHFRSSTQTISPEAFVPHPYQALSVTRHLMATEEEIWAVGEQVASVQSRPLYGRADIQARSCRAQNLNVHAAPIADNPNHADITGWPTEKPKQKMIAILVAATARYYPRP